MSRSEPRVIDQLRASIAQIGAFGRPEKAILPFGIEAMDGLLPSGGLVQGALHEVTGGGQGAIHGAAAALFVAGILARLDGQVLWCLRYRDLFAPALAGAGLHPDRVVYAETGSEEAVLLCVEEGLRHGGLAGVVGEVSRLSMTGSRRLQLAAEASGVGAYLIRRYRTSAAASDFGQPTAAVTKWRVTAMPSAQLPVQGVGRARWLVELIRARSGDCGEWILEACDDTGHLALPSDMADRSAMPGAWRTSAAS
jgi:protein ImuA